MVKFAAGEKKLIIFSDTCPSVDYSLHIFSNLICNNVINAEYNINMYTYNNFINIFRENYSSKTERIYIPFSSKFYIAFSV